EVAFYEFYSCAATKFTITNTKFQDLYFERTDVQELRLLNSFLFKVGIKDSSVTPFIQNCEIRELSYLPKVGAPHLETSTTYRLLRAAFQSSGLRQEASNFYYKERVYERKSYFHPQLIDRKIFQGLDHGGQISILKDLYDRGFFEKKDLPKEIRKVLVSKVKMHVIPKYLFPLMKSRFKWFVSLFESILWGYGERPSRIILVALATVTFYSGIYSYFDWLDEKGNPYHLSLLDSSYFSVVTFTTLGYGDITPKTEILKLLAGSEALLGAFTMGLIVAGFSNRSRY
ncbi:potassium channel family protein, partial [Aeromonas caviae]